MSPEPTAWGVHGEDADGKVRWLAGPFPTMIEALEASGAFARAEAKGLKVVPMPEDAIQDARPAPVVPRIPKTVQITHPYRTGSRSEHLGELLVDGEPFPYAVLCDDIRVEQMRDGLCTVTVTLVVEGTVTEIRRGPAG